VAKERGPHRGEGHMSLAVAMLMVAAAALGFWPINQDLRVPIAGPFGFGFWDEAIALGLAFALGGLSLLGPPLHLVRARGRRWGAGRMVWFACGAASWTFWPPYFWVHAFRGSTLLVSHSAQYFFLLTPLIAILILASFLAGGWLRPRRRPLWLSWQENFGILLGLAWACLGIHRLAWLYYTELYMGR
jgi:uncharacterized metal-binding protein